jgi:CBS domain-containing protein
VTARGSALYGRTPVRRARTNKAIRRERVSITADMLAKAITREVPLLEADETVGEAVAKIIEAGVSALPIVDAKGRL